MFRYMTREKNRGNTLTTQAILEPISKEPATEPTILPKLDDIEFKKEYIRLAQEIGITTGKVPETELRLFLEDEGISVLNTQSCFDYLTVKAKREGKVWSLYPLRQADKETYLKHGTIYASVDKWPGKHGHMNDSLYRSRVPYPVLLTIKKLIDKFGGRITFYIAALGHDPFLVVVLDFCNLIFIERWDEPSFRGK